MTLLWKRRDVPTISLSNTKSFAISMSTYRDWLASDDQMHLIGQKGSKLKVWEPRNFQQLLEASGGFVSESQDFHQKFPAASRGFGKVLE